MSAEGTDPTISGRAQHESSNSSPRFSFEVPENIESYIHWKVGLLPLPRRHRENIGIAMAYLFRVGFERLGVDPNWQPHPTIGAGSTDAEPDHTAMPPAKYGLGLLRRDVVLTADEIADAERDMARLRQVRAQAETHARMIRY